MALYGIPPFYDPAIPIDTRHNRQITEKLMHQVTRWLHLAKRLKQLHISLGYGGHGMYTHADTTHTHTYIYIYMYVYIYI